MPLHTDPSPLGCLDRETEFKVEKLDQNTLMSKCIPLMPNAYSLAEPVLLTWSAMEQYRRIDELYSHVVTYIKTDIMVYLQSKESRPTLNGGDAFRDRYLFYKLHDTKTSS